MELENENETTSEENIDYIGIINELKEGTVPKETYNKLLKENKELLNSLVKGETISPEGESVDVAQLRKELFSADCDLSNLDYMQKVINLRDAIIAEGGMDPFLPYGKKILPTDEDISTANRVAETIKECIEYAEGDSAVFTNELQRRMIDSSKGIKRTK